MLNNFKIYLKNIAFIPGIYNSIVIKKNSMNTILIVFYNNLNKLKLALDTNKNSWSFDPAGNSIITQKTQIQSNWTNCVNRFNLKMFLFEALFFEKIKFSGKGFKITFKKRKKFLRFMFGHSHIKFIFMNKTKIKRLTKYKYILKDKNKNRLRNATKLICDVRPLNIFTKRGLRKTRQIVFKRRGKKSTYV